jgi:hypothetical protein
VEQFHPRQVSRLQRVSHPRRVVILGNEIEDIAQMRTSSMWSKTCTPISGRRLSCALSH